MTARDLTANNARGRECQRTHEPKFMVRRQPNTRPNPPSIDQTTRVAGSGTGLAKNPRSEPVAAST